MVDRAEAGGHYQRAVSLANAGRWSVARLECLEALKVDPRDPLVQMLLIRAERAARGISAADALARVRQVIDEHPALLDPRIAEASYMWELGNRREAIDSLRALEPDFPRSSELRSALAMLVTCEGEFDTAWKHYRQVAEEGGLDHSLHRVSAYACGMRAGHAEEVRRLILQRVGRYERTLIRLHRFRCHLLVAGLAVFLVAYWFHSWLALTASLALLLSSAWIIHFYAYGHRRSYSMLAAPLAYFGLFVWSADTYKEDRLFIVVASLVSVLLLVGLLLIVRRSRRRRASLGVDEGLRHS